jgi:TolA-binding protein
MEENKKTKVWLYAVILFTSAFLILMFTAYSQIKMNKSLDRYKNQIYSKETEKNEYLENFTSAQEMNKKLNEEINDLKKEKTELENEVFLLKVELENSKEMQENKDAAVEALLNGMSEYLNGNTVESAGYLKNIDNSGLEGSALELFNGLSSRVYSEAGEILYNDGFRLYKRGDNQEAAAKLLLSTQYAPSESFSGKCMFYLAYAELKIGNKTSALEHMNRVITDYPSSGYLKSAKIFVEKYKE